MWWPEWKTTIYCAGNGWKGQDLITCSWNGSFVVLLCKVDNRLLCFYHKNCAEHREKHYIEAIHPLPPHSNTDLNLYVNSTWAVPHLKRQNTRNPDYSNCEISNNQPSSQEEKCTTRCGSLRRESKHLSKALQCAASLHFQSLMSLICRFVHTSTFTWSDVGTEVQ